MYDIVISDRAAQTLNSIRHHNDRYTEQERASYYFQLKASCHSLNEMPYRFSVHPAADGLYRSFTFKAHTVYYRIDEPQQRVEIMAILHAHADAENHL